ncbi:hypothetical protein [Aliivibrio fischeri]|uniref:hypothetical protein n=1 Tax=Aliivibrio fischeri TaxID=668 RepID=UPI0007C4335B|nr:hypothetical protein [Aliivibrio fischeri]
MNFFQIKSVSDAFQKGYITTTQLLGTTILTASLSMDKSLDCALTAIVGLLCFIFAIKAQSQCDVE